MIILLILATNVTNVSSPNKDPEAVAMVQRTTVALSTNALYTRTFVSLKSVRNLLSTFDILTCNLNNQEYLFKSKKSQL